jgi:antirestriction protein ArdC
MRETIMSTQNEIRERITAEVVAALEKGGLPPWRRTWGTSGPPANAATGRRYSGVNVLLLQLHRQRLGLAGPCRYATFNQWQALGCRVKARPASVPSGRWGCNVVFCKPVKRGQRDDDEGEERKGDYLLLRNFTVFNVDQVEGEAADRLRAEHAAPQRAAFADYDPAERAVAATGADIRHGSDRAFYRRPTPGGDGDFISVPHKHAFESEKEYYSTLLHELGHWTECRLNWAGSYAEGELRAEMASAFALAELGVPQSDDLTNHITYLASWLKELRADPRFIFRVSADASRAVDFLLSFSGQRQAEHAEAVAV